MLTNFNRNLEIIDGLETDYLKLLYYDLLPMSCDYKSYECSRLCTIIHGYKHVSVNKEISFTYESGQFVLLPPYSCIHMDIDVPTKALVFDLKDNLLKKVSEKINIEMDTDCDSLTEDRFFLGNINEGIRECLNKIIRVSAMSDKNKEFLMDLYAQELVYHLVKIKGIQHIIRLEHDHPIQKSIKYIQSNIVQPISISQLACDLNMSEANYCNAFKKTVGITPKEYITNLKLTKARDMLRNKNVTEVAFDLGYENISHFIALFKSKYGITPKQFKSIGQVPVVYKY